MESNFVYGAFLIEIYIKLVCIVLFMPKLRRTIDRVTGKVGPQRVTPVTSKTLGEFGLGLALILEGEGLGRRDTGYVGEGISAFCVKGDKLREEPVVFFEYSHEGRQGLRVLLRDERMAPFVNSTMDEMLIPRRNVARSVTGDSVEGVTVYDLQEGKTRSEIIFSGLQELVRDGLIANSTVRPDEFRVSDNAWYALALHAAGHTDESVAILNRLELGKGGLYFPVVGEEGVVHPYENIVMALALSHVDPDRVGNLVGNVRERFVKEDGLMGDERGFSGYLNSLWAIALAAAGNRKEGVDVANAMMGSTAYVRGNNPSRLIKERGDYGGYPMITSAAVAQWALANHSLERAFTRDIVGAVDRLFFRNGRVHYARMIERGTVKPLRPTETFNGHDQVMAMLAYNTVGRNDDATTLYDGINVNGMVPDKVGGKNFYSRENSLAILGLTGKTLRK